MNHLPPRNLKLLLECIRSTGIPPFFKRDGTSKPQITIVCGKTTLALTDGNLTSLGNGKKSITGDIVVEQLRTWV